MICCWCYKHQQRRYPIEAQLAPASGIPVVTCPSARSMAVIQAACMAQCSSEAGMASTTTETGIVGTHTVGRHGGHPHRGQARRVATPSAGTAWHDTHLGDFAEEQDAVRAGGVEGEALRLVVRELGHELQRGRGHVRRVCPGLQAGAQRGQVRWVQPVEEQACAEGASGSCDAQCARREKILEEGHSAGHAAAFGGPQQ